MYVYIYIYINIYIYKYIYSNSYFRWTYFGIKVLNPITGERKLKIRKYKPSGIAIGLLSFTLRWDQQTKDYGIWS